MLMLRYMKQGRGATLLFRRECSANRGAKMIEVKYVLLRKENFYEKNY